MSKETVLYLGNFLNEEIVIERKLPTNNTAGSNRIKRISQALSLSYEVKIISSAITLRNKFNRNNLILKKKSKIDNGIEIIFAKTLAIPVLGLLFSHITYPLEVLKNIRKNKVKNLVLYNFGSLNIITLFIIKIFIPRIKILNNIEDISVFSFKDFSLKSEDNLLQQLFFSVSMKITAFLSHGYIIPTERFLPFLPSKKNILVINGCIKVNKFSEVKNRNDLNILFAGKIAFEHGIKEFIECLKIYDAEKNDLNVKFNITGTGPKSNWLKQELESIDFVDVEYHGFVTDKKYSSILADASICIALQKPDGRHANYKTPSKVYEYLGNSKIVVATNVGDFKEIQGNLIRICDPLNARNLKLIIDDILSKRDNISELSKKVNHYAFENYDYSNVSKKLQKLIKNVNS